MDTNGCESEDEHTWGQTIRPKMTSSTACKLTTQLYGLRVEHVEELNSYVDKNYKISVLPDYTNPNITDIWPHGYVLKVLNSPDSQTLHIDAEHEVLKILHKAGIRCPQAVLDIQGRDNSVQKIYREDNFTGNPDGEREHGTHAVRLLTYVPGDVICDVPFTADLLIQAGCLLGQFDKSLIGFYHVGLTSYQTIWSLSSTPRLRDVLDVIDNETRRQLVENVINVFQNEVIPNEGKFQKGVIHGDFNDQNLLVQRDETGTDDIKYNVAGVIDFGDMSESAYVYEVATAITAMSVDSNHWNPLSLGGLLLAGYLRQMALRDAEWQVLKECVCARYCQLLVLGPYYHKVDPANDYLLSTAIRGWDQLKTLWETPKQLLYDKWQSVIRGHSPDVVLPRVVDIL